MTPTAAEVLETAMSLSPDERVDVATKLLRSAGTEDAIRLETLRENVTAGFAQIDRGAGVEISLDELRDHIRGLGREAAERVARKPA